MTYGNGVDSPTMFSSHESVSEISAWKPRQSQRLLNRQTEVTSGSDVQYWLYLNGVRHDAFQLSPLGREEHGNVGDSDSISIPLSLMRGHCTTQTPRVSW